MAASITENEHNLLTALINDEYQSEPGTERVIGEPVWSWSPCQAFGKSAGGIVASLSGKGLIDPDMSGVGHGNRNTLIGITREGWEAWTAAERAAAAKVDEAASDTAEGIARIQTLIDTYEEQLAGFTPYDPRRFDNQRAIAQLQHVIALCQTAE